MPFSVYRPRSVPAPSSSLAFHRLPPVAQSSRQASAVSREVTGKLSNLWLMEEHFEIGGCRKGDGEDKMGGCWEETLPDKACFFVGDCPATWKRKDGSVHRESGELRSNLAAPALPSAGLPAQCCANVPDFLLEMEIYRLGLLQSKKKTMGRGAQRGENAGNRSNGRDMGNAKEMNWQGDASEAGDSQHQLAPLRLVTRPVCLFRLLALLYLLLLDRLLHHCPPPFLIPVQHDDLAVHLPSRGGECVRGGRRGIGNGGRGRVHWVDCPPLAPRIWLSLYLLFDSLREL
jgi:hypothetical protein